MRQGRRELGAAWWKAGLRRRIVVAGLLLASTTGYLAGAALFAGYRGSFLEPSSSRTVAAGWTVLTPSFRTNVGEGTDVVLSRTGPWVAQLVGFDHSEVRSVVYWVRDAGLRWRASTAAENEPFTVPVSWWEGDNSGYEAVTAHVTLRSGRVIRDPGGWHWIDGRHANPEGSTAVHLNSDGSADVSYTPVLHAGVIRAVQFWLRGGNGRWTRAGTATDLRDGAYTIHALAGTKASGWRTPGAAVGVHVVWPNGTEFVDPHPWVWSSAFGPAPAPRVAMAPPRSARPASPGPQPPHLGEPVPAPKPEPPALHSHVNGEERDSQD